SKPPHSARLRPQRQNPHPPYAPRPPSSVAPPLPSPARPRLFIFPRRPPQRVGCVLRLQIPGLNDQLFGLHPFLVRRNRGARLIQRDSVSPGIRFAPSRLDLQAVDARTRRDQRGVLRAVRAVQTIDTGQRLSAWTEDRHNHIDPSLFDGGQNKLPRSQSERVATFFAARQFLIDRFGERDRLTWVGLRGGRLRRRRRERMQGRLRSQERQQ